MSKRRYILFQIKNKPLQKSTFFYIYGNFYYAMELHISGILYKKIRDVTLATKIIFL